MSANAIETLRGLITDHAPDGYDQVDLGWTWGLRREGLEAVAAVEALLEDMRHLASPNWHVAPSGRDAREMAAYAAAAVRRLETGQ